MSRFILTALRSGSGALRAALPIGGDTAGIRSTTDNSGDLYYATLDNPVRYRGADIHQVFLRPTERGQTPHYGMRGFAVDIAPITDPMMRTAEVIDPALLDFVAGGEIDDASDATAPPPPSTTEDEALPPPAADSKDRSTAPRPAGAPPVARSAKRTKRPLLIGAAAAAVLAAAVATMLLTSAKDTGEQTSSSSSASSPASAAPATPAVSTVAPVDKPDAVLRLVPPGYKAGACTADAGVPVGARAAVTCSQNTDPGGPTMSHYTLFSDKASLQDNFNQVVADSTPQVCPGRIMSPGPWRHNATPEITAGTLFCGTHQDTQRIGWTDDAKLLLAVVESTGTPGMEDMFNWWSSHS